MIKNPGADKDKQIFFCWGVFLFINVLFVQVVLFSKSICFVQQGDLFSKAYVICLLLCDLDLLFLEFLISHLFHSLIFFFSTCLMCLDAFFFFLNHFI